MVPRKESLIWPWAIKYAQQIDCIPIKFHAAAQMASNCTVGDDSERVMRILPLYGGALAFIFLPGSINWILASTSTCHGVVRHLASDWLKSSKTNCSQVVRQSHDIFDLFDTIGHHDNGTYRGFSRVNSTYVDYFGYKNNILLRR